MTVMSQVEAVLFVVGDDGISLEELSYLLELPTAKTFEVLSQLMKRYEEDEDSALNILEVGNQFVLSTKRSFASLLKKYAQSPIANNLSPAALETLSIVAYKQPISRVEVDEIRGVQSAGSIQKLAAKQLIEEKGRVDGPGRAILYGTTNYFMDYFGLKTLDELPDIQDMEEEINEELPLDLFFDRYKEELAQTEGDAASQTASQGNDSEALQVPDEEEFQGGVNGERYTQTSVEVEPQTDAHMEHQTNSQSAEVMNSQAIRQTDAHRVSQTEATDSEETASEEKE